ncbi:hypothetical protein ACO0LB_00080 [Undibacterium sp. SXout7W]|uniref:hypothetical protein n=1 Tax=Undibacterium sp. SXout7W TaxID=3413049 RepID=UPI003BEFDB20
MSNMLMPAENKFSRHQSTTNHRPSTINHWIDGLHFHHTFSPLIVLSGQFDMLTYSVGDYGASVLAQFIPRFTCHSIEYFHVIQG